MLYLFHRVLSVAFRLICIRVLHFVQLNHAYRFILSRKAPRNRHWKQKNVAVVKTKTSRKKRTENIRRNRCALDGRHYCLFFPFFSHRRLVSFSRLLTFALFHYYFPFTFIRRVLFKKRKETSLKNSILNILWVSGWHRWPTDWLAGSAYLLSLPKLKEGEKSPWARDGLRQMDGALCLNNRSTCVPREFVLSHLSGPLRFRLTA